MKRLFLVTAALALLCIGIAAQADLLFDRGLPSANLNNGAGSSRSNVTWQSEEANQFTGDDFVIGTAGQSYVIDSITVWGAQYNPLQLDVNNIWLYVGKAGDSLALLSTGSVTGNTNSNTKITHKFVTYADGQTDYYVGNGGTAYSICETTFSGMNLLVDGGVKYDFGVKGDNWLWWSHASNAGLSGTTQSGADGLYKDFITSTDLSNATFLRTEDSNGNGWDKSSDINVQITGNAVPEPMSIMLGIMGLGSVAGFKRLRRK